MSFFLQGMALGLLMISPVMFFLGLYNPNWVLPKHKSPGRLRVFGTYAFMLPTISFFLGVSTFWGGFGPTLVGWLTGIFTPITIKWLQDAGYEYDQEEAQHKAEADRAAQVRQTERQAAQEQDTAELDARQLNQKDCSQLHRLADIKTRLADYAGLSESSLFVHQPNRFYNRYLQLTQLMAQRFQPDEMTARRIQRLILQALDYALERFEAMEPLLASLKGLDQEYVARRLQQARHHGEKKALKDRQRLINDLEERLLELVAENEAALTTLDTTLTALAQINTQRQGKAQAAIQALDELKRFSTQLNEYDRSAL